MSEQITILENDNRSRLMRQFADEIAGLVVHKLVDSKARKSVTIQELFENYLNLHLKAKTRTWRNYERMYSCYLKAWGDRQVSEITRHDIEKLLVDLSSRVSKTSANRVIQFLRPMISYGIKIEIIDGPNPASGISVFKLQSRERFLEREEVERLLTAINTLRYETTRDFLILCLFTGARRSNVAAMRWEEVSLERNTWTIPRTKNGSSQLLPLPEAAAMLLRQRFMKRDQNNPWVFPSERSSAGHLTKPENAWQEVLKRAKLDNVRIHDLRRTLGSWEAITGANISVIAATLNHKDLASTQIYARLNSEPVREAMNTAIKGMTGKEFVDVSTYRFAEVQPNMQMERHKPAAYQYQFGFGVNEAGERVRLPEEVKTIKDILAMRRSGMSLKQIADELNRQFRYRRGRQWNKSHIDFICRADLNYLKKLGIKRVEGAKHLQ